MSLVETALHKLQTARARDIGQVRSPLDLDRGSERLQGRSPLPMPAALPDLPHHDRISIPKGELRGRGLLPLEHFERAMTNQYRRIKQPLIASALGTETEALPMGRSLVVTSAMPGEGKTFTSLNLAMSLALEKDFNVLLVDGDVAKRELSDVLHVSEQPGLIDLLSEPSRTLGSCVVATDQPGLFVMPAGERRASAPELLGSARMHGLFADLLAEFPSCFIVFDSPPVLVAAEARSLLPIAGQIVVVVKAGASPRQSVLDALSTIGSSRPVSLILNQTSWNNDTNYAYGYSHEGQSQEIHS